jgi:ABC-2 type transport system ATP-binding protein
MVTMISIQRLTKNYNELTAVDDLSLEIEEGAIFGFVGPNGAGKTSTIRMMATLLKPTHGDIWIAGHSVLAEPRAVRRAIGYMPDYFGIYPDMLVWEYLDFFGACYRIPETKRDQLIEELLELVDLSHRRSDKVETLSRGMKQRLSLARTLVHDPQVLLLDEPASGLDPRARVEIRELLVELARLGKTIFFSTHILSDVAEISTSVGIIEAGRLIASGSIEDLQQLLMPHRLIEITLLEKFDEAIEFLRNHTGVLQVEVRAQPGENGKSRLEVLFSGDDRALHEVLFALVRQGFPVIHFSADSRNLEEVFLSATKGLVT